MLAGSGFAGLISVEQEDDFFQVFQPYDRLQVFVGQSIGAIQSQDLIAFFDRLLLQQR
jgi:hypothetical protein